MLTARSSANDERMTSLTFAVGVRRLGCISWFLTSTSLMILEMYHRTRREAARKVNRGIRIVTSIQKLVGQISTTVDFGSEDVAATLH